MGAIMLFCVRVRRKSLNIHQKEDEDTGNTQRLLLAHLSVRDSKTKSKTASVLLVCTSSARKP
jgi:hypothetical protein